MFRPQTQARGGFSRPQQSTRLIDSDVRPDDNLDPVEKLKLNKVQPFGTSTKLFIDYYQGQEAAAAKVVVAGGGQGAAGALSAEAAWANADAERRAVKAVFDRLTRATPTEALTKVYTPKYPEFTQQFEARASAAIQQAFAVLRPTVLTPEETREPSVPADAPKYDPEAQPKYDPEAQPKYDPEAQPKYDPEAQSTVPEAQPIDISNPAAAADTIAQTEATTASLGLLPPTLKERAQLDDQIYGYRVIPAPQAPKGPGYLQATTLMMTTANRVLYDSLNPSEAFKFSKKVGEVGTYTALHTTESLETTALYQYVTANAEMVLNLGPDIPKTMSDFLYVETAYVLLQRYKAGRTSANTPDEVTAAMAYAKAQVYGYASTKTAAAFRAMIWKGSRINEETIAKVIDVAKAFPTVSRPGMALQYMASLVDTKTVAHAVISARDRSYFTNSMVNFLTFFDQSAGSMETAIRQISSYLGFILLTKDMATRGLPSVYEFLTTFSGLPSAALQFIGGAYFRGNRIFEWACFLAQTYRNLGAYKVMAFFIWRALSGMARRGHLVNAGLDPGELDAPGDVPVLRQLVLDMQADAAQVPEVAEVAARVGADLLAAIPRGLEPTQLVEVPTVEPVDAPGEELPRLDVVPVDAQRFLQRLDFLGKLVFADAEGSARDKAREAFVDVLKFLDIRQQVIDKIIGEMTRSKSFQFTRLLMGTTMPSSPILESYLETNRDQLKDVLLLKLKDRELIKSLAKKFAFPFRQMKTSPEQWVGFSALVAQIFGADAKDIEDIPAEPSDESGDGQFSRDTFANEIIKFTPDWSLDHIGASDMPANYKFFAYARRRNDIMDAFSAIFQAMGATKADTDAALGSLVNNGGFRSNGRHGSYPDFVAFLTKYSDDFAKFFARYPVDQRIQYGAIFCSRFFGLRGRTVLISKIFGLTYTDYRKLAQQTVPIDPVKMDFTWRDGDRPSGPEPTAVQLSAYERPTRKPVSRGGEL